MIPLILNYLVYICHTNSLKIHRNLTIIIIIFWSKGFYANDNECLFQLFGFEAAALIIPLQCDPATIWLLHIYTF